MTIIEENRPAMHQGPIVYLNQPEKGQSPARYEESTGELSSHGDQLTP